MKSTFINNQRGYSLGELAIAISIISVLVIGSVLGVQAVLRTNNVNRVSAQTNTAVNRIISRMLRETSHANASLKFLTTPGLEIWDSQWVQNGGTDSVSVKHMLGSNIYVRPLGGTEAGVASNQGFVYTLTGIPKTACVDLAVGLQSLTLSMGIHNETPIADTLNAGNTLSIPVGYTKVKYPDRAFDSATANAACGGSNQTATISLLIPRR